MLDRDKILAIRWTEEFGEVWQGSKPLLYSEQNKIFDHEYQWRPFTCSPAHTLTNPFK
jgi:peptidoglycan hydrolase-like amidase